MDTLEIPRLELMNYLPYSLIEEALEYSTIDLATLAGNSNRKESRIKNYVKAHGGNKRKLHSLINACEIENEVCKEVNKILHSKNICNSIFGALILDQTKAKIKHLLRESADKENINPYY